ncbi:MAG: response regulator [candidate division Zixibacteria bacterium]|nr:response regulator [candidate division Zixibacteria bacterium]
MAKVLVVDDSNFQRKWLTKSIKKMGHDTVEAVDGCDGLEKIEAEQPDCIITDLLMPNMNGIELLEQMRKNDCQIPTVVVTADIQKDTKTQCQELGAKGFLNKPFKHEQLERAVNICLQGK